MSAVWVLLTVISAAESLDPPPSFGWYNGTPTGVPSSFDCAARILAWQYGQQLVPHRGGFKSLFDALQLGYCNVPNPPIDNDVWKPPELPELPKESVVIYVDAVRGSDRMNTGRDPAAPLQSVGAGVSAARQIVDDALTAGIPPPPRHLVVSGRHFLPKPISFGPRDSGLHIRGGSPPGDPAEFTGAKRIQKLKWQRYHVLPTPPTPAIPASFLPNMNNVYNEAVAHGDSPGIKFLGIMTTPQSCQGACNATTGCMSFTWHPNTSAMGDFKLNCFGRTTSQWKPRPQSGMYSGQTAQAPHAPNVSAANAWVADVSASLPPGSSVLGLRVNGARGIRARFPNANPETASSFPPWVDNGYGGIRANFGWQPLNSAKWVPQPKPPGMATDFTSTPDDWPGVEWPQAPIGLNHPQNGTGDWGMFIMGTGGTCDPSFGGSYDPPYGYYCSSAPPRGQQFTHNPPVGMTSLAGLLPRAPYRNVTGAVVHAWMPQHYYSNSYSVMSQTVDADNSTSFEFSSGGFQGSIGQGGKGGEWYMENVLEELDAPMEWFYDAGTAKLYYVHNSTGPPSPDTVFEVVMTKTIFTYNGTKENPITNVSLRGVTIRDTAYTYLDPHGAPSGGDWALQRSGAVTIAGTEGAVIDSSLFTRVDGLGVFISGYNRNLTIHNSTFEWIGGSAMAAWGDTSYTLNANGTRTIPWPRGPDARDGNFPLGTRILSNVVSDIGVWQKQVSMWFQATSAQTLIQGNVHFNGPRAGINFNDGMGGGDEVSRNLMVNTCRESGDHGPVNSWDRAPYITTIGLRAPNPSVFPQFRNLHHNYFLANYNSQEAVDNDDGSSFYWTHDNFFVYGDNGLKSDFGGHDNHHENNVYAYVGGCFNEGNNLRFQNNTCILRGDHGYSSDCELPVGMNVSHNSIYTPSGNISVCGGVPLANWVASGHDNGTSIESLPSDAAIVQMGRLLLGVTG